MGTEASKGRSAALEYRRGFRSATGATVQSLRRRSKEVAKKWRNVQFSQQLCAVVRHCERADSVSGMIDGQRWYATEDYKQYPLDPPLSDAGLIAAADLADKLAGFVDDVSFTRKATDGSGSVNSMQSFRSSGSLLSSEDEAVPQIGVVVTSPYFRCLQTAVAICEQFPNALLLVDNAMGEVYGPSVMGSAQPGANMLRPAKDAVEYCRSRGIAGRARVVGKWPEWPEDLRSARSRFAQRYLSYLHRSVRTRKNFVIVTHGDGLAAVLSLMPSHRNYFIEEVDYGAGFFAHREATTKGSKQDLAALLEDGLEDIDEAATCQGGDLQAAEGWQVQSFDVKLRKMEAVPPDGMKRTKSLARRGEFSQEQIQQLLGAMPMLPLGSVMQDSVDPAAGEASERKASVFSNSTLLFGASEGCFSPSLTPRTSIRSHSPGRLPHTLQLQRSSSPKSPGRRMLRCRSSDAAAESVDEYAKTPSTGSAAAPRNEEDPTEGKHLSPASIQKHCQQFLRPASAHHMPSLPPLPRGAIPREAVDVFPPEKTWSSDTANLLAVASSAAVDSKQADSYGSEGEINIDVPDAESSPWQTTAQKKEWKPKFICTLPALSINSRGPSLDLTDVSTRTPSIDGMLSPLTTPSSSSADMVADGLAASPILVAAANPAVPSLPKAKSWSDAAASSTGMATSPLWRRRLAMGKTPPGSPVVTRGRSHELAFNASSISGSDIVPSEPSRPMTPCIIVQPPSGAKPAVVLQSPKMRFMSSQDVRNERVVAAVDG
eukprot:TRINITY_DN12784_c0_g2_i2.p1 TRINITY_DN12784_c0_g2~~TRINITY_DN12784_c0_g2_i2.p1  ORF type:complete len:771 (+),score=144.97 TRINITY_DN12784_c0_g2_i2:292-2604(+)